MLSKAFHQIFDFVLLTVFDHQHDDEVLLLEHLLRKFGEEEVELKCGMNGVGVD
uniref:Uncharacterized protein n=1 Tax=Meloidogyne enterolobii TaxID=390850 RepID=A0A6V7UNM4_MELEN|nr:unnamed protein product [Meloidogyne enterolobii]